MRSILRATLLLVTPGIVTGCVGYGYLGTATFDDADPTADEPARPRRRPGLAGADLLASFGEPDERRATSQTTEEWTYDDGWRWNGPILFVVIPIPLVVPVGHESTTYHLANGVVERVVRVEQSLDGHVCGLMGGTPGCRTLGH